MASTSLLLMATPPDGGRLGDDSVGAAGDVPQIGGAVVVPGREGLAVGAERDRSDVLSAGAGEGLRGARRSGHVPQVSVTGEIAGSQGLAVGAERQRPDPGTSRVGQRGGQRGRVTCSADSPQVRVAVFVRGALWGARSPPGL
jgi:hypothetical protein